MEKNSPNTLGVKCHDFCEKQFTLPRASEKRIDTLQTQETLLSKRNALTQQSPSSAHSTIPDLRSTLTIISKHEKRVVLDVEKMTSLDYSFQNRVVLLEWMKDFAIDHSLDDETYHLAVLLLDRYSMNADVLLFTKSKFQLIAMVCIMIAMKHHEVLRITPKQMLMHVGLCDSKEAVNEVIALESAILRSLDWSIHGSTCISSIYLLVEQLFSTSSELEKKQILSQCYSVCDVLILSPRFYEFSLAEIAKSVLHVILSTQLKSRKVLLGSDMLCKIWVECTYMNGKFGDF